MYKRGSSRTYFTRLLLLHPVPDNTTGSAVCQGRRNYEQSFGLRLVLVQRESCTVCRVCDVSSHILLTFLLVTCDRHIHHYRHHQNNPNRTEPFLTIPYYPHMHETNRLRCSIPAAYCYPFFFGGEITSGNHAPPSICLNKTMYARNILTPLQLNPWPEWNKLDPRDLLALRLCLGAILFFGPCDTKQPQSPEPSSVVLARQLAKTRQSLPTASAAQYATWLLLFWYAKHLSADMGREGGIEPRPTTRNGWKLDVNKLGQTSAEKKVPGMGEMRQSNVFLLSSFAFSGDFPHSIARF